MNTHLIIAALAIYALGTLTGFCACAAMDDDPRNTYPKGGKR